MGEALLIIDSARKHGIVDKDIEHGLNNPILIEELDESLIMVIGPDRSGRLLEVGIVVGSEGPVVVHAMQARAKYLR